MQCVIGKNSIGFVQNLSTVVEPDFAELACIGRVVNMAVGNDADQRLVGNHLDCAAQIANTHAAVNDHRLFRADQQENTGTVKFMKAVCDPVEFKPAGSK